MLCHKKAVKRTRTNAQTTFAKTPAEKTIALCQIGLFKRRSLESCGTSEFLSSSGNETYPPNKKAWITRVISPTFFSHNVGPIGKPIPNLSTLILLQQL